MSSSSSQKGLGAKFAGATVEYIGPGPQYNGYLADPSARARRGGADRVGVATGRLPKGRRVKVSPHVAAIAARHPDRFVVRDAQGRVVEE